jgi:hypothetical protein
MAQTAGSFVPKAADDVTARSSPKTPASVGQHRAATAIGCAKALLAAEHTARAGSA